jgi:hypothetical protein
VSDPYNSYGSAISPATPAAVTAPSSRKPDPIARLNVSEAWKRRFRLIEKAGGPDLPRFRDLPFGERFGLNFNVLAFFFGPIYYLAKGLWRQAALYLVIAVALLFLLDAMGFGEFSRGLGYGFAAVYALRANVSYYKKAVLGDAPWL